MPRNTIKQQEIGHQQRARWEILADSSKVKVLEVFQVASIKLIQP